MIEDDLLNLKIGCSRHHIVNLFFTYLKMNSLKEHLTTPYSVQTIHAAYHEQLISLIL